MISLHNTIRLSKQWVLCAVISCGALFPPFAVGQSPCTCDDLPAVKDFAAQIEQMAAAWREVLNEAYSTNPPTDMAEARKRFREKMWGEGAGETQIGGISPGGDVVVSPSFREQNCESIVNSTVNHEKKHKEHYFTKMHLPQVFTARGLMRTLAMSETEAHDAQVRELQNQIAQMEDDCALPPWIDGSSTPALPKASVRSLTEVPANLGVVAKIKLLFQRLFVP